MPLSQEELAILVTGKDVSATRVLRGVSKEADRFSSKLAGIGSKAGRNFARNLERTIIAGSAAAAGAIGYSLKVAGDFEAQLNTINTIARETPDALSAIGAGIREIARDTGTPLEELTQGYYDLLSAGVKAADAQTVLKTANTLAIGGLATTAETVDLLTTAINTYGGDASKATQYADEFAKAIERGKVTADEIAASYANVGPLAASLNIENRELAAGYARLTAGGTAAGEASTQMASAMTALLRKTGDLEKLEKATGRNYAAIAGKKGLAAAFEIMRKDAEKAGVSLIDLVGRKEALLYILQVTGAKMEDYNADLAAMDDSAGTAAEQAAERQKGFNYQLGRLKANVQDAAITIGTELLPAFADLAEEGADWLRGHQPEIKAFAQDLARGIREAVEWARKLDWDGIARALGMGATAAQTIASTFMALPTDFKALLVGGYAANKVTGGAVTDVGGLLLKQFAGRGSSPANPLYVSQVGGIGGAGAGAGAAGGALGALGKVFLVGEAIGLVLAVKQIGENIGDERTKQAQDIHQVLAESLAGPNSLADLQIKLAGIDEGIARLPTDPLGGLVTSGALAELQAMRAEVVAAINAQTSKQPNSSGSPDDRQEANDQREAIREVAQRVNENKAGLIADNDRTRNKLSAQTAAFERSTVVLAGKLQENKAAQMAAADRISAAVRASRPIVRVDVRPITNVSVRWTSTGTRPVVRTTSGGAIQRVGGAVSAEDLY